MVKVEAKLFSPDPIRIKYRGYFDIKKVHKKIYSWLKEHKFKTNEKLYKNKPAGLGTIEIEYEIEGRLKIDEYYKKTISIKVHVYNYETKEVIINNKKEKKNYGKIIIEINGTAIADHYEKYPDIKEAKGIFEKIEAILGIILFKIRANEFDTKIADTYYYQLLDFSSQLKKELGMKST